MERGKFIKLSGLTAIGLLTSGNVFSGLLNSKDYQLIKIGSPNLHVRHGFFNIQDKQNEELSIQRDIFNKNGLEDITNNRITSLKISHKGQENFGILNTQGFKSNSKKISEIKLSSNSKTTLYIDSQALLFSEYDTFSVDDLNISNDLAYLQNKAKKIVVSSKTNQSLFVFDANVNLKLQLSLSSINIVTKRLKTLLI